MAEEPLFNFANLDSHLRAYEVLSGFKDRPRPDSDRNFLYEQYSVLHKLVLKLHPYYMERRQPLESVNQSDYRWLRIILSLESRQFKLAQVSVDATMVGKPEVALALNRIMFDLLILTLYYTLPDGITLADNRSHCRSVLVDRFYDRIAKRSVEYERDDNWHGLGPGIQARINGLYDCSGQPLFSKAVLPVDGEVFRDLKNALYRDPCDEIHVDPFSLQFYEINSLDNGESPLEPRWHWIPLFQSAFMMEITVRAIAEAIGLLEHLESSLGRFVTADIMLAGQARHGS